MNAVDKKKILCPLVLNEDPSEILKLAKKCADEHNGLLILLNVISPNYDPGAAQHKMNTARAKLEQMCRDRRFGSDTACEVVVREGDPAAEVLKAERELGVDFVILPTHKHQQFFRPVSDGISHQIIDESECPVVAVPERVWKNQR